ncbi:MAG TPA: MBL fold metallo-hydrolase [Chloroflexia bacterium]|jgi:glyoxylase-like metal-dependent hydrolase (beta-lactamase superfamily II)|nr:MBL fold metallo-hydrolase [Chloroflexia bacterium]
MTTTPIPTTLLSITIRTATGEWPISEVPGWHLEIIPEAWDGPGTQARLRANWEGTETTHAGLVVHRKAPGAMQRVLIPAMFYGDNGTGNRGTHYPRLGPRDERAFTAPGWDFAAERTPLPAVFLWTEETCAWLACEPHGTGVGFNRDGDTPELRVHRPGLEAPFRYDRLDESPSLPLQEVHPGTALELIVWYGDAPADDPDAYAPVQRALQTSWGGATPRPIDPKRLEAASEAAEDALLRDHYRDAFGPGVLVETVSFDRREVRDEMHVAWISGAPAAYGLLRHARRTGDAEGQVAAAKVLDTVAGGLAPCGAFWGIWTPRGWRAGWNGNPRTLHARTLSEATLFMTRALALEPHHPNWRKAVRSNLDFCLRAMNDEGHPGSYYQAQTGAVLDRRGTAGLLWAAALAEAGTLLDVPAYREAAVRVGDAYASAIREGTLLGAPEDIGLCPSSEDGYNAVISMIALHTLTGDNRWRDLARAAADWMLTFRWSYNVRFPVGSPLARRGFQTRGADAASPSNNHLHAYGLICQPELRRLSALLSDPWYADRAADHLACFLGEVPLRDGALGGRERRGMMSEQWYTVNWSREGRAGEAAPVSHAWCLGLLLFAADDWLGDLTLPAGNEKKKVMPQSTDTPLIPGVVMERPRVKRHAAGSARTRGPFLPPVPDHPHPVRLLPGFYQIGGGYLSHPRDAASYLLLDEASGDSIMVDCGSHSGLPALRNNVNQVADLSKVRMVIGTHGHWDHVEAFGHLRSEMDARFAIHERDADAVRNGDPDLTCAGFLYNEPFDPFEIDILLKGGEHFTIGDYMLEILHLPGHSPGSIGVLLHYARTDQTILIPGDAVQGAFGRQIRSNLTSWKKSMQRLMQDPPDLMVPNHLPGNAQTALLADVPNRLARIYSQLQTDFLNFMDHQRT